MNQRINQILELLSQNNRLEVVAIAQKLNVSSVTIRKDLQSLEERGIVKREHGFACLLSKDDVNGRMAYHYDVKVEIAKKASELIKDGETIMIESGSCCALLAEVLSHTKKDLTIITNSAFIADRIQGKANFQIILLGGIYQNNSRVMVGPMVRQCVENFYVDKFFIGTDSYSPKTGFTNCDQLRAQAVKDMARQVFNVIVLTESEKFLRHGIIPLNLNEQIKTVITDRHIDENSYQDLVSKNIEVITI